LNENDPGMFPCKNILVATSWALDDLDGSLVEVPGKGSDLEVGEDTRISNPWWK
jgi:hypothetical protein